MNLNNLEAFINLVKAGLWEKDIRLSYLGEIDFTSIYRLSEEQAVLGLVASGLEHVVDIKVPQNVALEFVGSTLQLEQRNISMNVFIADLINKLRDKDIYTLLVKGQGVAQCYERPLWRACGDIDLLMSDENYKKAKKFLLPFASSVEEEDIFKKHLGLVIDTWVVELHGTMRTNISNILNRVIDEVQNDVFYGGSVRSWLNDNTQVFLPSPNTDVIFLFTHFINHFYGEGVGLRQICDWCRFLWKYQNDIDHMMLERRIRKMKLMTEWKAFASLAVEYLGMPQEAMPLFVKSNYYSSKALNILKLILETGSFGLKKDNSYRGNHSKIVENSITFKRRLCEFSKTGKIFPLNSLRFFVSYSINRIKVKVL